MPLPPDAEYLTANADDVKAAIAALSSANKRAFYTDTLSFAASANFSHAENAFLVLDATTREVKTIASVPLEGSTPQFAGIELGHVSDTTITRSAAGVMAVEGVPLFSNLPQNSQSAAYTTVLADAQKHILHPSADTTARTFTIASNASVAYPVGTAITFINQNAAGTLTIAITSDTMRLAGAGTTGSRTLTANGIATAIKIASTEWIISGTNLT